jgi:hypothetical protein
LFIQKLLHPVIRFAHKHAQNKFGKPQIMPARAKRKRTWMAVSSDKIEDNVACLRGAVNGGAEKKIMHYRRRASSGL